MKNKFRFLFALLALVVAIAACKEDEPKPSENPINPKDTTLNKDFASFEIEELSLYIDETKELAITISETESVAFSVAANEFLDAKVEGSKISVTGIKVGETTLSVTAKKDGYNDTTVVVKVTIDPTEFYINPASLSDGNGTETRPFNNLETLNAKIKSLPNDRTLTVYVMTKIYIDNEITIDGTGKNIIFSRYVDFNNSLIGVSYGGNLTLKNITIDGKNMFVSGFGGGCVHIVDSGSSCTMIDCTITGGKAFFGGGVAVRNGATFEMIGGTITANSAEGGNQINGGGVYVDNSTFIMKGGSITDNTVGITGYGGGVFVTKGSTFKVSGNVQITNNKKADYTSNVHLQFDNSDNSMAAINIADALDENSNIGVTLYGGGYNKAFTSGWSTSGSTKKEVFSGDESGYNVVIDGNELKLQK